MINFKRTAEPPGLPATRAAQLLTVGAAKPERTKAHDDAARSVKEALVAMQNNKCCYCEDIVKTLHNDVEHFRPFSRYWWLAWTWENLFFACSACDRAGGKHDQFPVADESKALAYPMTPPGLEEPLLLDPTDETIDLRQHIHFEKCEEFNWKWAPIGITNRGRMTIKVIGLRRDAYITLFNQHVETTVQDVIDEIHLARAEKDDEAFARVWRRKSQQLLLPERRYRALSEDVLRHEFPSFPNPPPR